MDKLPIDDEGAYRVLQEARTTGVFQLESTGMKRYLKQLKPTVFEDIIAMVALYRPGPMEYIPDFIGGKHGTKQIEYLHPKLEPILKNTYGVAVLPRTAHANRARSRHSLVRLMCSAKQSGKKSRN